MKTVMLYGHLGEEFGRVFRFDVRSPAEALRALISQFPGFRDAMIRHPEAAGGYRIIVGGRKLAERDELGQPCSDRESIRIVPVLCGAGGDDGGTLQTFVGIVLVAVGSISGFSTTGLGLALIAGGVSQMLAENPKTILTPETPENQPSYTFDGPVNTVAQGNPVPLAYGQVFAGSQVISAGMSVEQL